MPYARLHAWTWEPHFCFRFIETSFVAFVAPLTQANTQVERETGMSITRLHTVTHTRERAHQEGGKEHWRNLRESKHT